MRINLTKFFIHIAHQKSLKIQRQAKLLLNASLLTSLFSLNYLIISSIIDFEQGVYFMAFNVVGFLVLPFLLKTKLPLTVTGNIYVFMGTLAVVMLTYYSGGLRSPILSWLVATPTIALLIVNKRAAYVWTALMLVAMLYYGWLEHRGTILEPQYNLEWHTIFSIIVFVGLLLIVFVINLIFELNRSSALDALEVKNVELNETLEQLKKIQLELVKNHKEILGKNEELLKQQEEIAVKTDSLSALNEEKDYIIEILAHDLNAPLSTIQGLISLFKLDAKSLSEDQKEYLGKILGAVQKSKELVTKVTDMTALEQESLKITLEVHHVTEILQEVIREKEVQAWEKGMHIRSNLKGEPHCIVDKVYLYHVFDNIVSNAIKFSPKGSNIYVKQVVRNARARIEIRDEGPGIPTHEIEQLFAKYTRLSARPTGGETSTGLGLSLVKRYVKMMNGEVWCESKPGEGATFFVEFPIAED